MERYLAHIAEDGREQTVQEHLTGTAKLAATFALFMPRNRLYWRAWPMISASTLPIFRGVCMEALTMWIMPLPGPIPVFRKNSIPLPLR